MNSNPATDQVDYSIPGGMDCTICGLRYFQQSMGGPGICPSCDCGYTGPAVVAAQKAEIERLKVMADAAPDLLAALRDVCSYIEGSDEEGLAGHSVTMLAAYRAIAKAEGRRK